MRRPFDPVPGTGSPGATSLRRVLETLGRASCLTQSEWGVILPCVVAEDTDWQPESRRHRGMKETFGIQRRAPHPYVVVLAVLFAFEWLVMAIRPRSREDWMLENALSVAFVAALALSYRGLALSRTSYTTIFVFLSLHTVGAHYTYSEVPYDAWARGLTGHSLNELLGWQRNHFDRFTHFSYGFLLAYPIREILIRRRGTRILGILSAAGDHDVHIGGLRARRMRGRVALRWRARRDLSRNAGRRLGRPEGHGARRPGCVHRDERTGGGAHVVPTRLRAGMGGESPRQGC